MPPTGCDASGKTKNNGAGENKFSPPPFFVFISPVAMLGSFLQVSCGNNRNFSPNSFRKPESRGVPPLAQGTGAAKAPASSSPKLHAEITAISHTQPLRKPKSRGVPPLAQGTGGAEPPASSSPKLHAEITAISHPQPLRKPESRGVPPLARGTGGAEAPALVVHIKTPSGGMIPEGRGGIKECFRPLIYN